MSHAPVVVLVVEDEPLLRMATVERLADEGFIVFEAADADQAIAILETVPEVSLLFTDIDMPGSMDGWKLSKAVQDRWPPVKIILTSGHHTMDPDELPTGGLFIPKPYDYGTLAGTFRAVLFGNGSPG